MRLWHKVWDRIWEQVISAGSSGDDFIIQAVESHNLLLHMVVHAERIALAHKARVKELEGSLAMHEKFASFLMSYMRSGEQTGMNFMQFRAREEELDAMR